MDQEKLLKKFEIEFEKTKKELNFNSTLDELDKIFFLKDYILQTKFVSLSLSRFICHRIRDTFYSWISQFHEWVMPNPSSMISNSECSVFNEEEKQNLLKLIKKFMAYCSQNVIIGLSKDKIKEKEFIDNSIILWNENINDIINYTKKINNYWDIESKK
ncbi:MAG: hypothetical protein ACLFPJ_05140 [Candidatus Woesearchaeota archaeon]